MVLAITSWRETDGVYSKAHADRLEGAIDGADQTSVW